MDRDSGVRIVAPTLCLSMTSWRVLTRLQTLSIRKFRFDSLVDYTDIAFKLDWKSPVGAELLGIPEALRISMVVF